VILDHIYRRLGTRMQRELVVITRARVARSTRAIPQSASAGLQRPAIKRQQSVYQNLSVGQSYEPRRIFAGRTAAFDFWSKSKQLQIIS
jgi:hypothetical protein